MAAGSLQFLGTTLTSDGAISIASNAALLLSSSSLSAGATVSLASGATLALASSTLGTGVSVSGAGSTSLSGAIGFGTGATTFSNLVWSPEASAIGMNAALTLSGTVTLNPNQANANEHLYANTGSATMTVNALGATDLFAFAGVQEGLWDDNTGSARWNNLAGATFTLHDTASLITAGVGSIFTNAVGATFAHAGTSSALIQWNFVNHGTLSLPTGTLQFLGTTLTSDGAVSVASGASLQFSSATLDAGATVSLASGAALALTSSTLGAGVTVNGTGGTTLSGTLALVGDATLPNLVWLPEATVSGANATLTLSGTVALNSAQANANEHLFANPGSATLTINAFGATDLFGFSNVNEGHQARQRHPHAYRCQHLHWRHDGQFRYASPHRRRHAWHRGHHRQHFGHA